MDFSEFAKILHPIIGAGSNVDDFACELFENIVEYPGQDESPIDKKSMKSYKSYSYTTPNDTGTGSRTRGMMLFDYVSLSNTPLPALIEDSMTLKQIEDEAMIKLFELFNESKKQVFVAIDKAESYSDDNTVPPVFSKTTVLELSAGHELFGRAWNKSEEK